MVFALFILAVGAYVAFLAWCLFPIVRPRGQRWLGRLRIAVGLMLLAANVVPPLALPLLLPIHYVNESAGERLQAVILFARTVPIYVHNVLERDRTTAGVVDIRYPIEIAGVSYGPVVRTACTTRKMLDLDKGILPMVFEKFPTWVGGVLVARVGPSIIAIDHGYEVCSNLRKGGIDLDRLQQKRVFVVRGEAEKTQLYSISRYPPGTVAVDDIVLAPPELVSLENVPARDVIPLAALWPMLTHERNDTPEIAKRFFGLPAGVNACVEYVVRSVALPGAPTVRRSRPTKAPREKQSDIAAYCRDVLPRYIPQSEVPILKSQ